MTLRWPFGEGDPLEGTIDVLGANPNPMLLLVIAYGVRRLPYVVRSTVAGLEQTSGELEEAAMNLGGGQNSCCANNYYSSHHGKTSSQVACLPLVLRC